MENNVYVVIEVSDGFESFPLYIGTDRAAALAPPAKPFWMVDVHVRMAQGFTVSAHWSETANTWLTEGRESLETVLDSYA